MSEEIEKGKLKQAILRDIQQLYGGQSLYLKNNGTAYVQVVRMRQNIKERRYKFSVPEEKIEKLEELIFVHDFFNIVIREREGHPEESKIKIKIILDNGREEIVEKWSGDQHKDFDTIYNFLFDIIETAKENAVPTYKGPYDFSWRPESFEI